jgi:carbonic anhydrase
MPTIFFVRVEFNDEQKSKVALVLWYVSHLLVHFDLFNETSYTNIIRNAGGIATDDAIRSLIISHELLGTQEFVIMNHTDCGMLKFTDKDLQKDLRQKYKSDASEIKFYSFPNLEENVKNQVNAIKSTLFFSQNISVHGFIYDIKTDKIERITDDQKTFDEISIPPSS